MFDQAVLITGITVDQPADINEETKRKIIGRVFFFCVCVHEACVPSCL